MQYSVFNNPYNNVTYPNYAYDAAFDPGYFNSYDHTLLGCGLALNVDWGNGAVDQPVALPGQTANTSSSELESIALVYHGYFLPPSTGSYTFNAYSDDYGYMWIGQLAYGGWNKNNYNASGTGHPSAGVPIPLNAGYLTPVTLLYANAAGPAKANFTIKYPDGTLKSDFTGIMIQPNPGDYGIFSPPVKGPYQCANNTNPQPACGPLIPSNYNELYYGQYQTTSGTGAQTTTFDATTGGNDIHGLPVDACGAIAACGNFPTSQSPAYKSFDVHFSLKSDAWECVAYASALQYGAFTGYSSDISAAFGYNIG